MYSKQLSFFNQTFAQCIFEETQPLSHSQTGSKKNIAVASIFFSQKLFSQLKSSGLPDNCVLNIDFVKAKII
jgi:hypothetical protein